MGTLDYIVLGLVFALAAADVFFIIRSRKKGVGCCGDCSKCESACGKRPTEDKK